MIDASSGQRTANTLSRRHVLQGLGVYAGTLAMGADVALGQAPQSPVAPPSTVTMPPRDFGPGGAPTTYFWDPDVIAVDPTFNSLAQPNAPIQRLWTGALWAEGQRGTPKADIWSGATSPTTGSYDGSRMTGASACSVRHLTTAMATPSIFRDVSCRAST